jgi:hypothetical protein
MLSIRKNASSFCAPKAAELSNPKTNLVKNWSNFRLQNRANLGRILSAPLGYRLGSTTPPGDFTLPKTNRGKEKVKWQRKELNW